MLFWTILTELVFLDGSSLSELALAFLCNCDNSCLTLFLPQVYESFLTVSGANLQLSDKLHICYTFRNECREQILLLCIFPYLYCNQETILVSFTWRISLQTGSCYYDIKVENCMYQVMVVQQNLIFSGTEQKFCQMWHVFKKICCLFLQYRKIVTVVKGKMQNNMTLLKNPQDVNNYFRIFATVVYVNTHFSKDN